MYYISVLSLRKYYALMVQFHGRFILPPGFYIIKTLKSVKELLLDLALVVISRDGME